jgi:hypothetical protein
MRESRPAHWFGHRHHSYSSERVLDPVVLESEIQGLDDLRGYFVQQDKVVAIRFHPRSKRTRAIGLIERVIPTLRAQPAESTTSAEEKPAPEMGFGLLTQESICSTSPNR